MSTTDDIQIRGIQKSNVGPIREGDDIVLFENGVIGGPISQEYHSALHFSELLEKQPQDE